MSDVGRPSPRLMVLPDADARADFARPIFGLALRAWAGLAARTAGWDRVTYVRGVQGSVGEALASPGEACTGATLVLFEGTLMAPGLLTRLRENPPGADDAWVLYDTLGRPCAAYVGNLERVPRIVPSGSLHPSSDRTAPFDLLRVVDDVDRERAEAHLLSVYADTSGRADLWGRRLLRALLPGSDRAARSIARYEVLCAATTLLLALPLLGGASFLAAILASVGMAAGVAVAGVLPVAYSLATAAASAASIASNTDESEADGVTVHPGFVRSISHAALTAGLTLGLVGDLDAWSSDLVMMAVGGLVATWALFDAHAAWRGSRRRSWALPSAAVFFDRIPVPLRTQLLRQPALPEQLAVFVALTGSATSLWAYLVLVGSMRMLSRLGSLDRSPPTP